MKIKAIQINKFGGPEVLEWSDIKIEEINQDQILIKVLSAGVNPIDAKIREGSSFVAKTLKLPSGIGYDICGEVIKKGDNVSEFSIGDIVMGRISNYHNPGSYSEYCIIDPKDVVKKPLELENLEAGALSLVGITAWQGLHKFGNIKSGERVLIHAGAGGVGHLAIQYAKLAGAYVITTAAKEHHEALSNLGADEIIDYKTQNFEIILSTNTKLVDLVFDLVGGETGIKSLNVLKTNGRIVTVPTITSEKILKEAKTKNINATGMVSENNKEDLKIISKLAADKKANLLIANEFNLKNAQQAHEELSQSGRKIGKIVLVA